MTSFIIILPILDPAAFVPKSIALDRSNPAPASCLRRLFLGPIILVPCRLGQIFLM